MQSLLSIAFSHKLSQDLGIELGLKLFTCFPKQQKIGFSGYAWLISDFSDIAQWDSSDLHIKICIVVLFGK